VCNSIEEIPSAWIDILTYGEQQDEQDIVPENSMLKNHLKLSAVITLQQSLLFEPFFVHTLYEQTSSSIFSLRGSVDNDSLLLSTVELDPLLVIEPPMTTIRCHAPLFQQTISCEDLSRIGSGTDLKIPNFYNMTTYVFADGLPLGRALFTCINGKIVGRIEKLLKYSCRTIFDNIFLKDHV
jgi:hypothetical protein